MAVLTSLRLIGLTAVLGVCVTAASPALAQGQPGGAGAHDPPSGAVRLRPYTGMTTGGKMALRYVGNTVIDDGRDPDVVVLVVDPDSPASQAGLAVGDVILEVNGVSVHDRTAAVLRLATGVSYALRIRRGQDELEATLVPGPERAVARPRGLQ